MNDGNLIKETKQCGCMEHQAADRMREIARELTEVREHLEREVSLLQNKIRDLEMLNKSLLIDLNYWKDKEEDVDGSHLT